MSMTLVLAAVSAAQFEQLRADPPLLQWLHEWSTLDWSTTLRGIIAKPEECEPEDLARMQQVDAFGLSRQDFCAINYLAMSRPEIPTFDFQQLNYSIMDAFARAQAGDASALQALQQRSQAFLSSVTPNEETGSPAPDGVDDAEASEGEALAEDDGDAADPSEQLFAPEGELAYDAGYGNCLFWSPARLAEVASGDDAWRRAREADPDLEPFISRAQTNGSYVIGIVY
jgi:hypothetical protein